MCLANEEPVDHLLICPISQFMWRMVLRWFGCSWVFPYSLKAHFEAWKMAVGSKRGKDLWRSSFLAIIWNIWKVRNASVDWFVFVFWCFGFVHGDLFCMSLGVVPLCFCVCWAGFSCLCFGV